MEDFKPEKIHPRPSYSDIEEKIRNLKAVYEEGKGRDKDDKDDFGLNIDEIREYIQGEGDPDEREEYYSGWTKEDFETLLKKLEREGLLNDEEKKE